MKKSNERLMPQTKEYWPKRNNPPILSNCGHGRPLFHPGFDVGLAEPFLLLHGLCKECVEKATMANVLTDERWGRMAAILEEHGERVPTRKSVRMKLFKTIPYDNSSAYSYALAA